MKLKALVAIERLFVTCSMTAPSADLGALALAHVHRRQGYADIAVHFVIRRDGRVEAGRGQRLRGAASPAFADSALQVCLIGGLNDALEPKGSFTEAQLASLWQLQTTYRVPLIFGHEPPLTALSSLLKDTP